LSVKQIEVVAAIITHQNRYLCVRRGESSLDYISKKWEFPGGKIEPNESETGALTREIREELEMNIANLEYFTTVTHAYPDFMLTMHAYICTSTEKNPTLSEHIDFKWLTKEELSSIDWAAADIPIVHKILSDQPRSTE